MESSDFDRFADTLEAVYAMIGRNPPNEKGVDLFFRRLKHYPIDAVVMALESHDSNFPPTPGDVTEKLEGGSITSDQIIAAARLAETPLGIMARIKIGTWDLSNQDGFYLRQRAEEVIQKLPQWRSRYASGELTDHEITTMLKYGVNPEHHPFYLGAPRMVQNQTLSQRAKRIYNSEEFKALTQENENPVKKLGGPMPEKIAEVIAEVRKATAPKDRKTIDLRCKSPGCTNHQHTSEAYQIDGIGRVCFDCFNRYALRSVANELKNKPIIPGGGSCQQPTTQAQTSTTGNTRSGKAD